MTKSRPNVADTAGEESDGLFVKQSRKKKRRLSRLGEYDEDPGRAGSQKYQRLANMLETCITKEAAKSHAFLRDFEEKVKIKDTELRNSRQKKEREITKGQETYSTTLQRISRRLSDGINGQPGVLRKESHPLFRQCLVNTEIYQSIMEQFKLVEEQLSADGLETPLAKWKQDKKEIKELLACSGKHGETLLGSLLAPEPDAIPGLGQPHAYEESRFAEELFRDSREMLKGRTWGRVAEEQIKQLSIIARTAQEEQ